VKINLHAKLSGRRRGKDRGLIGGLATSASSRIQKIEKKKKRLLWLLFVVETTMVLVYSGFYLFLNHFLSTYRFSLFIFLLAFFSLSFSPFLLFFFLSPSTTSWFKLNPFLA